MNKDWIKNFIGNMTNPIEIMATLSKNINSLNLSLYNNVKKNEIYEDISKLAEMLRTLDFTDFTIINTQIYAKYNNIVERSNGLLVEVSSDVLNSLPDYFKTITCYELIKILAKIQSQSGNSNYTHKINIIEASIEHIVKSAIKTMVKIAIEKKSLSKIISNSGIRAG